MVARSSLRQLPDNNEATALRPTPKKRIAIVGAGTSGITMLKTLVVDIPEDVRDDWEVVVYEHRDGVGGTWFPDDGPFSEMPKSPLYPLMTANVPHPTMTIPHFPFPPGTPLYPGRDHVHRYHADIVQHFKLTSHIRFFARVVETRWHGDKWTITIENCDPSLAGPSSVFERKEFDHLIVANGHFSHPREVKVDGLDAWRARADKRVMHSIFYRSASNFAGKNVLIIGAGSSARDLALEIVEVAKSTIFSRKESLQLFAREPDFPGVTYKPPVASFTNDDVVFEDGTSLPSVDVVILATGYDFRVPFLTRGGRLDIVTPEEHQDGALSTSLRYVRPLFRHIFALDHTLPPTALSFVGLPMFSSNQMTAAAQALLVGYALANPDLLPSRDDMLAELRAGEARLRDAGHDPAYVGHRLLSLPGDADPDADTTYQDGLIRILQDAGLGGRGGVPPKHQNFTEEWRRYGRRHAVMLRDRWQAIEKEGVEAVRMWVGSARTEEEWAGVMQRLVEWDGK